VREEHEGKGQPQQERRGAGHFRIGHLSSPLVSVRPVSATTAALLIYFFWQRNFLAHA
jgi:hypothetical protein